MLLIQYASFLAFITMGVSDIVEGSLPVLQKTVISMFTESTDLLFPGMCQIVQGSPRQAKMCKNNPGLIAVLRTAKAQAITACQETFRFDRWNCSIAFNNKPNRSIFSDVYRETALVHALLAASITHAVAKACATGNLSRCSCTLNKKGNANKRWKRSGCGDDFKFGKRIARNFLDLKHAGNDQIADILKQDVIVGIESVGEQMREVCRCHGFSGSCTTKTCWRRTGPFNSTMAILKKQYHHAVLRKIINYTSKRALGLKKRRKINKERKSLVYMRKSPNLCAGTKGRQCRNPDNCATLCCNRGYDTMKVPIEGRCKCRMVNCCYVQCDTCKIMVDMHVCK